MDERRRLAETIGHAVLAGRRLHRSLRPARPCAASPTASAARRSIRISSATSQPMIRLVSGDLTLWTDEKNPCGRTYPRLPQGIFGRIDDMFTIRGENVYPSEIDAALNELPQLWRRASHRHQPRSDDGRAAASGRSRCADPPRGRRRDRGVSAARSNASCRRCSACARWSKSSNPASIAAHRLQGAPCHRRPCTSSATCKQQIERSAALEPLRALRRSRRARSRRRATGDRAADFARRSTVDPKRARRWRKFTQLAGRAHVIGITGVPGSGKSTLVGKLDGTIARQGRARSASSRSTRRAPIPAARSSATASAWRTWRATPASISARMATRGATGGMARATLDAVDILDVAGFETVIIETVGVGQDEVEIAKRLAHHHRRLGARPRRRNPGDQGRHSGDRRHSRRVEMRPQRRQPHA